MPGSAPKNETKAAKSKRLAEIRMTKLLTAAATVERLSDPDSYDFSAVQKRQIIESAKNAVARIEKAFANPKAIKKEGFTLA